MSAHVCTSDCEAAPRCTVCGLTKQPSGRSIPLEMSNSRCNFECPGYSIEPLAGHLFHGELARSHRIAITGGPRTGKTTLAEKLDIAQDGCDVRHTDSTIEQFAHLGKDSWSAASAEVASWLDAPGPWVVEGVSVSRALRKWRDQWRAAHPGEPDPAPPVDRVIYLSEPLEPVLKAQAAMAKGVATVHAEIEEWLASHGVRTERPAIGTVVA